MSNAEANGFAARPPADHSRWPQAAELARRPYNTEEDVDAVLPGIAQHRRLLR